MIDAEKRCKLCNGVLKQKFSLPLSYNFKGIYFECQTCSMLQTFHLDMLFPQEIEHFYKTTLNPELDSGAAWRIFCVLSRIRLFVRLGLLPGASEHFKVLDLGGGTGFTASALRAQFGWTSYSYDPHPNAFFSPDRFLNDWNDIREHGKYHFIIASEVFEHFIQPRQEIVRLHDILDNKSFVYITTGLYSPERHDRNWTYLAPQSAQHVSFYSRKAIQVIKQLLGASVVYQVGADYEWFFVRKPANWRSISRSYHALISHAIRLAVRMGLLVKIV